jgi:hypothetical protein
MSNLQIFVSLTYYPRFLEQIGIGKTLCRGKLKVGFDVIILEASIRIHRLVEFFNLSELSASLF